MEVPSGAATAAFLVVGVVLVIVWASMRVVNQHEKVVVFRLGHTDASMVRGPGLRFLIPVIDRGVSVDLRETRTEVPSQTAITKDQSPIGIGLHIYWRIEDPLKRVLNVSNFSDALHDAAITTLHAVIGDIFLSDVLPRREQISEELRARLDDVTRRWGGKVTTVEIREITPPRSTG